MSVGRVKWFSNEKGYGFIETVECAQDVFVHFSEIAMEGYKTLKVNTMVRFVLQEGMKGPSAKKVNPLGWTDGSWEAPEAPNLAPPDEVNEAMREVPYFLPEAGSHEATGRS